MKDLSLHILDLVQNSLRAGAKLVEIYIEEKPEEDLMVVEINDNGKGMSPEEAKKALDPFYTTRATRRIGLGLPLFEAAARRSGGGLTIESLPGTGTKISATFVLSHWDRPPLGDISETIVTLLAANPSVDLLYLHRRGEREYLFDTRKLRPVLEEVSIATPSVLNYVRDDIKKGIDKLQSL